MSKRSPYDRLGVPKEATSEQIKKAYRKKANVHHPDKGGSPEEFRAVALAYKVLGDDDRRKRYDSGESEESVGGNKTITEEQEAVATLVGIFNEIVGKCDPKRTNVAEKIIETLEKGILELENRLLSAPNTVKKFEAALARFSSKGEDNLFAKAATSGIEQVRQQVSMFERQKRVGQLALKLMEGYEYKADAAPPGYVTINVQGPF